MKQVSFETFAYLRKGDRYENFSRTNRINGPCYSVCS